MCPDDLDVPPCINFQVGKSADDVLKFPGRPGICYPIVPGHEISGVVHSLGGIAASEGQVTVGDRVMVYPWLGCMSDNCSLCAAGDTNACLGCTQEIGFGIDGGYSEYVVVPDYRSVLLLPDNISFSTGALLPCSGLTAYSAILKCMATVEKVRRWGNGVVVVVIGLGGLGQWALKLLPFCFGREGLVVIGIDISARKIEVIKEGGLVDKAFVLSHQNPVEAQATAIAQEMSRKANVVLDFVNSTSTFTLSVNLLEKLGVHVMVGLHGGLGELQLPLATLSGCTHVGCIMGTLEELKALVKLVSREAVSGPPVKGYKLCAASQALKDLEAGQLDGRAVLDMQ
jgi:propanol-preferring alcohol dehydrogenase